MKRFLALFSMALVLTVVISVSVLALHSSAYETDVSNDVIYISDSGSNTADGSSASAPMGNITSGQSGYNSTDKYKNTALYRAAEKLADTGGTIVICGNVTIGDEQCSGSSTVREFYFPKTDRTIYITSKDESTTYNAKLTIAENAYVLLSSPTVWRNLKIHTTVADRVICCNGYKTVFGEGITTTTDVSNRYLSIAGGTRYLDFTGDTNITVKSGTYFKILGSSWGGHTGASYVHTGDSYITIEGTTHVTHYVSGVSNNTASTYSMNGNAYITIAGGQIDGAVYGTSVGGFYNQDAEVHLKVTGGKFSSNTPVADRLTTGAANNNHASKYYIDLSEADGVTDASLSNIVNATLSGTKNISYPAKWADSVTKINEPTANVAFAGEIVSSEGAKVNVTFKNPVTGALYENNEIEYNQNNKAAFSSVYTNPSDLLQPQNVDVTFKYGGKDYLTKSMTIIKVPVVEIEGAQIRTEGSQQIRFKANYTTDISEGVEIVNCGIISIASDLLVNKEYFNHEQTAGMYDKQPVTTKTDGYVDLYRDVNGKKEFTVRALDYATIKANNYCTNYTARAYVKIQYNGQEYYRYSDIIERNPYYIAKQAINNTEESQETRSYLKTELIDVYDNYDVYHNYNDSTSYRNRVINYMKAMANIEWVPDKTFALYNGELAYDTPEEQQGTSITALFKNTYSYLGMPYVNDNIVTLEEFKSYLYKGSTKYYFRNNEFLTVNTLTDSTYRNLTTRSDVNSYLNWKMGGGSIDKAYQNYLNFPGNDCVSSVILAWNTVLNNRPEIQGMNSTNSLVPGGYDGYVGVIPLGDYEYEQYNNNTNDIVTNAGQTTMYAAYDLLQPGDAIIAIETYATRHARLVLSVDKTNKTVLCLEQANFHIPETVDVYNSSTGQNSTITSNNSTMHEKLYTYAKLYEACYLPITIPELSTGNSDNEFTYVTGLDLENDLPVGKLSGIIKSNRQVISVRATFTANGNTQSTPTDFISLKGGNMHAAEYDLSTLDLSGITLTKGTKYTFDLYAVVSGLGENSPGVRLVNSYEFTA